MTRLTRLISLDRCRPGAGTFIDIDNRELAVFYDPATKVVNVIDNSCPHASGNLSGGEMQNGIVSCPWHHWQFDLTSGVCTHSELARVNTYQAFIQDGYVWAYLP